jgi:hypothetical protein
VCVCVCVCVCVGLWARACVYMCVRVSLFVCVGECVSVLVDCVNVRVVQCTSLFVRVFARFHVRRSLCVHMCTGLHEYM